LPFIAQSPSQDLGNFQRIDIQFLVIDIDERGIFFVPVHDTSKNTVTEIDPELMVDIPERDMVKLKRIRRENWGSCEFRGRH